MKKKLIVATAIVLIIAFSMSLLVGCDEIFKKNEKRDAQQIVATVTYDGANLGTQVSNIYKYELATTFNSYAYIYVNYYGMSYEATANYLAQSLASQRLLALYATDKLAGEQGKTSIDSLADLLTNSEINHAIEEANESLLTTLVSLVEDLITEDNANNASSSTGSEDDNATVDEKTTYTVRFESNGGSDVEKQKVYANAKASEPTEPTKTGYKFYGWYTSESFEGEEFDFSTRINNNVKLYARWEKYVDPRTELPEEEEVDDYDPEAELDASKIAVKFYADSYKADLLDDSKEDSLFTTEFLNADFASKIESDDLVSTLKDYINEGLSELESTLTSNLYLDTFEECYDYYLNNQYRTLVIESFERSIGNSKSVSEAEIKAEFESAIAKNKETFAGSDTSYESALTSSLSSTYYHPTADQGYGFVINILFKLDDEAMESLNNLATINPTNVEAVLRERNRLISEMTAYVANPNYDADATVEDADGNKLDLRDPMTDENNPYNNVGKSADTIYQAEGGNDYSQIVEFKQTDGEWGIVFNATEHPAMAYLMNKVPVFSDGDTTGLIEQIYNSLNQVKTAGLDKAQEVYWLREVATTWAYLVSDDSGATSSDSNNGGLGYLITPEGKDSSYLADFTSYARELIKNGTGSYTNGDVTADCFKGMQADGTFAGNNKAFVIADSLVTDGVVSSSSSAYAGVFVLLNSLTVWDETNGTFTTEDKANGTLPMDYIVTYGKDADSTKTIYDTIKDSILSAKKSDAYNLDVNTMASNNKDSIEYFEKVIKQLWEDLA